MSLPEGFGKGRPGHYRIPRIFWVNDEVREAVDRFLTAFESKLAYRPNDTQLQKARDICVEEGGKFGRAAGNGKSYSSSLALCISWTRLLVLWGGDRPSKETEDE